jgi:hypothetical protein
MEKQCALNILKGIYPGLLKILNVQIHESLAMKGIQAENPDSHNATFTGE